MAEESGTLLVPTSSSENGVDIYFGVEALAKFESLIERFNFPKGMFPLINVEEFGIDQKINAWWLKLKEKYEHEFEGAKQIFIYMKDVSGKINKGKLFDVKGLKIKRLENKEMFLPLSTKEIFLDDPPSGKIHFKNAQGIIESFPTKAFF